MIDKNWFIQQYNEIHQNLSKLEKEITQHSKNRMEVLFNDSVLETLKIKVKSEIDRLNKTRDYERKIYGYDEK